MIFLQEYCDAERSPEHNPNYTVRQLPNVQTHLRSSSLRAEKIFHYYSHHLVFVKYNFIAG